MSYEALINKSIHGRELGLQYLTSSQSGSTHNPTLLNGPEAMRQNFTTDDSTSDIMRPYGVSVLSTESSGVHTLAPPIPGIEKSLTNTDSATTGYVKTRNGEVIHTSAGSTYTTLKWGGGRGLVRLLGITTAIWQVVGVLPTTVTAAGTT